MKMNWQREGLQKGSLMVEALAMLGLITMVTPVLYKKAAERTTELQDINVATQMRMVSNAVDNFLKDNYKEIGLTHATDYFKLTSTERDKLEEYLPHGFNTQRSKMFKDFDIAVRRREVTDANGKKHNIYTGAVLAPLQDDITIMRSSKIASMIGANGGVYRTLSGKLEGVQGTWVAEPDDYGFVPASEDEADQFKDGSLVVVSAQAIAAAKGDVSSDDVLYRIDDGDEAKNSMQTALYMDGNPIRTVKEIIATSAGNTVYIGSASGSGTDGNLVAMGTTKLKKALTVESGGADITGALKVSETGDFGKKVTIASEGLDVVGDTSLDGNLTVTGDTSLKATTIAGNLTQSGGEVKFTPTSFTVDATGNINMDADGNAVIGGTEVKIDGDSLVDIGVDSNGLTINSSGNAISGDTQINGDLTINGSVTVDWLYANDGIAVGDGEAGNYFTADANGVNVNQGPLNVNEGALQVMEDSFAVGGNVDADGNKININTSTAFIGHKYDKNTPTNSEGLTVQSASLVLRNASGSLKMDNAKGVVMEGTGNNRIRLTNSSVVIGVGTDGEEKTKIVAESGKVGFEDKNVANEDLPYSLYMESGNLLLNSKGIKSDARGLTLGRGDISTIDSSMDSDAPASLDDFLLGTPTQTNAAKVENERKVAISREGIIELRAPSVNDPNGGYIRARRLVSDVPYPENMAFHGYKADGLVDEMKVYDYYQVNPAYTSVMNDIKLASRGGARLSDILPDFINKGIYVVDNTYKESAVGNWLPGEGGTGGLSINANTGQPTSEPSSCSDNSCIASPWLGFVPAPQCPRQYAKVATINPIRWRMSEVYSVLADDDWKDKEASQITDYAKIISGEHADGGTDLFKQRFRRTTDPKIAGFSLGTASGDDHTHTIESGMPITFQTNTWLNTKVDPYYEGNDTSDLSKFIGWHAVMGFLYSPGQYKQLLTDINGEEPSMTEVYWNVFPVYAGDMAAVTNVYCYFDRHPLVSGSTSRVWRYGDDSPVYQYDQLNNYRKGNSKEAVTGAQAVDNLNDPTLEYNDVW